MEALLWIFAILNFMIMMKRPVFLSLSVIVVGLYLTHNTDTIRRRDFRMLVLLLVCSWIYDVFYFLFLEPSAADEDLEDGGQEYKLRRFIKFVSFFTIFYKAILILVFWKVSMKFRQIVRGKGTGNDSARDDDIDYIVQQY